MPDSDPAVIGVERCGCVTVACVTARRPVNKSFEADLMEIVRNGGEIRTTTVGEAKALPDFMPSKCPHDPIGWEPVATTVAKAD